MRSKRFRTRRLWLNTTAWATMSLFLLIVAVIFSFATDRPIFLYLAGGCMALGFAVAVFRDRGGRCVYVLETDRLVLRKGSDERAIPIDQVRDMSLLGRAAAREYFAQRLRSAEEMGLNKAQRDAMAAGFLRFCPIDLGMGSWSLGLGARMMDRMPSARHDFVLLRTLDGIDHLLAPIHHADMVSAIEKVRAEKRA